MRLAFYFLLLILCWSCQTEQPQPSPTAQPHPKTKYAPTTAPIYVEIFETTSWQNLWLESGTFRIYMQDIANPENWLLVTTRSVNDMYAVPDLRYFWLRDGNFKFEATDGGSMYASKIINYTGEKIKITLVVQ